MIKDTKHTRKLCIVAPLISFVVIIHEAILIEEMIQFYQWLYTLEYEYFNKYSITASSTFRFGPIAVIYIAFVVVVPTILALYFTCVACRFSKQQKV